MKAIIILISLLLVSCSSQDDFINETHAKMKASAAKKILDDLQLDLKASRPEFKINFESSEVIEIDGNFYLKARSGEYVSTTLLGKDEAGNLYSKGIKLYF